LPALEAKVMVAPLTALLFASFATALIVAELDPSAGMTDESLVRAMLEITPGGVVFVLLPVSVSPPHALNRSASKPIPTDAKVRIFLPEWRRGHHALTGSLMGWSSG
jgi:hypothetical protein